MTENIIQPEKYEVLRLKTGAEIVCMTIDKEDRVLAILPMVCFLTDGGNQTTRVSFQPYCALTSDINVVVMKSDLLHRSDLHRQYIELYDQASSKWMSMIEDDEIPISNDMLEIEVELEEGLEDDFSDRLEEYLEEMLEEQPSNPKKLH